MTLSTYNNAKLLQQLKSGFERTIDWIKYQPKITIERQNQYLYYLIDLSFQGVKRLFVFSFGANPIRTGRTGYFLLKVTIKDYNFMFNEKNFFDHPVKNYIRIYMITFK